MITRHRLVELIGHIREAFDTGKQWECDSYFAEIELSLPDSGIRNLCDSDYPDETVADIAMGWENTRRKLTRDELVQITTQFLSGPTSEAESVLLLLSFENNCINSAGGDLLLDPEKYCGQNSPNAEQIVDIAMKPS